MEDLNEQRALAIKNAKLTRDAARLEKELALQEAKDQKAAEASSSKSAKDKAKHRSKVRLNNYFLLSVY